ncbi:MAG: hypothetical protein EVJ46_06460 [Candidatus Acididesulfobacter guangdongensis]|jgi:hypothetical protein|uniref:Uncharacterized protein n=1 Tax=Acididesulfobacter guangdongensis TaxID=2597225 RepID=A0A519BEZ8_ACIG2|nr:MAG: hypothetical protein EVJ46_06460 [Candidatus Acididesulfobacter guangdongensis]
MFKSKKLFVILFLIAGFLFLFGNVQKASAVEHSSGIFISTLPRIANNKIIKDYGFIAIVRNAGNNDIMISVNGNYTEMPILFGGPILPVNTFNVINQNKPAGANACINLKFQHGDYVSCEYVTLSFRK